MIDTSSAQSAKKSLVKLEARLMGGGLKAELMRWRDPPSVEELKGIYRRKQGRNQEVFFAEDVATFMEMEILRQDGLGSVITRGALKMVDQAVTAGEILEKATEVAEVQLGRFNQVIDTTLETTKKRISQLSDYNNRLSTSLANLNKTLGDEKMHRAMENAEKLTCALKLLDELERKGSLTKIMASLKA